MVVIYEQERGEREKWIHERAFLKSCLGRVCETNGEEQVSESSLNWALGKEGEGKSGKEGDWDDLHRGEKGRELRHCGWGCTQSLTFDDSLRSVSASFRRISHQTGVMRFASKGNSPNNLIWIRSIRSNPDSENSNDSICRNSVVDLLGSNVRVVSRSGSICYSSNESSVCQRGFCSSFDSRPSYYIISSEVVSRCMLGSVWLSEAEAMWSEKLTRCR